jgi:hypothetical protein
MSTTMTVQELIILLSKYPPDIPVHIDCVEDIKLSGDAWLYTDYDGRFPELMLETHS